MKKWWINFLGKITPSCRQITVLCSESRDRKLTMVEKIKMRMHSWICSWCIDYHKQINDIGDQLDGESLADIKSAGMSDKCREKLKAIVNDQEQS